MLSDCSCLTPAKLQRAPRPFAPGWGKPKEWLSNCALSGRGIRKASPAVACYCEPGALAPAATQAITALSRNLHSQISHPDSVPASPCKLCVMALCLDLAF